MKNNTKWLPAFRRDSLYDLLYIAWYNDCTLPDFIPEEGWKALLGEMDLGSLPYDTRGRNRLELLLELAAEKEEHDWETYQMEGESDEDFLSRKAFHDLEYQTILWAEEANEKRAEIAKAIRKRIMDPDYFAKKLFIADDPLILCMQDILKRDEKGPEYAITLPWDDNYALDFLAKHGYFHLIERPANRDEECHRRILGLRVTGDVLSLFEKVYTPELDYQRRQSNLMGHLAYLGQDYYEVTPLSVLWKIYQNVAAEDPCLAGRITEEEFYSLFQEKLKNDNYWAFQEKDGITYHFPASALDILDEEETEDENGEVITEEISSYSLRLEQYERGNFDFYIPSAAEAKEFFIYNYWPSREAYKELSDLIHLIYEDQFSMEQFSFSMLWGMDEPEATCGGYTMDDVEENALEKISYICMCLQGDCPVENTLEQLKDMLVWLNEETQEKIKDLIIACDKVTNKPNLMGYRPADGKE